MSERRRPSLDAQPADPVVRAHGFRIDRLEEHVAELVGSLTTAWQRIERLERQGVSLAPTPAPAPTPQRSLDAPRVSARQAARRLGVDTRTIRRLVASGRLRGSALRLADGRRHWSVETASVERLLGAEAGLPAAPAASNTEISSASHASRSKG